MTIAPRLAISLSAVATLAFSPWQAGAPTLPPVDYRALVSQADLLYDAPVARSEEGMPIGNGRMGTLVWTTPSALRFQINRVDVQPINSDTDSFFERNSDYCGGCGVRGRRPWRRRRRRVRHAASPQHLSVYDGAAGRWRDTA